MLSFAELPLNIRFTQLLMSFGLLSLFFYSVMVSLLVEQGYVAGAPAFINVGLYVAAFFLLKRHSFKPFLAALFILGPVSIYNLLIVHSNYSSGVPSMGLYVWWPSIHLSLFVYGFALAALPSSWGFYRANT